MSSQGEGEGRGDRLVRLGNRNRDSNTIKWIIRFNHHYKAPPGAYLIGVLPCVKGFADGQYFGDCLLPVSFSVQPCMSLSRRLVFSSTLFVSLQGRRKHLRLGGHDTSRALFSLTKRGHLLKRKRALLCLLQNLGGHVPSVPPVPTSMSLSRPVFPPTFCSAFVFCVLC